MTHEFDQREYYDNISCWAVIASTLNQFQYGSNTSQCPMRMETLSPSPYFFSHWVIWPFQLNSIFM